MKALVLDNKVIGVSEEVFETHESTSWVDCPASCSIGWVFDGTTCAPKPDIELTYDMARRLAYPPMTDQLDDIFHNGVAGWKKTIQAVKDANPKPE
jgi:hypothetical protein